MSISKVSSIASAWCGTHEPSVLLLDEPTSGLDPASARHVRGLITELRAEGRAILVSTHNLAEAEQLSDRIAILNTSLLASDSPSALRRSTQPTRVIVEFEDAQEPASIPIAAMSEVPNIVSKLVGEGRRITRVTPAHRTLEEIYLDLVGEAR